MFSIILFSDLQALSPTQQVRSGPSTLRSGKSLKPFYENEAIALEPIFAVKHRAAPVVALVAHTTVVVSASVTFLTGG